jgi:flagellar basal body P-ring formation protein FlgA
MRSTEYISPTRNKSGELNQKRLAVSAFLLCLAAPCFADDSFDWGRLRQQLSQEWQQQKPDTVLRWQDGPDPKRPTCQQVQHRWPQQAGRGMVEIRCLQGNGWLVRLPVWTSPVGERYFAISAIHRDQSIQAQQIEKRRIELLLYPEDAVSEMPAGRIAKLAINPGQVLREGQLRQPWLVKNGQTVVLLYQQPGFVITGEGIALGNAALGEGVKIRTPVGKIVEGIVDENGRILLNGGSQP